jgi:hypothetical protein
VQVVLFSGQFLAAEIFIKSGFYKNLQVDY